jgi:hypothetical protein
VTGSQNHNIILGLHALVLPLFLLACHAEAQGTPVALREGGLAKAGAHAHNQNQIPKLQAPNVQRPTLNVQFRNARNAKGLACACPAQVAIKYLQDCALDVEG